MYPFKSLIGFFTKQLQQFFNKCSPTEISPCTTRTLMLDGLASFSFAVSFAATSEICELLNSDWLVGNKLN